MDFTNPGHTSVSFEDQVTEHIHITIFKPGKKAKTVVTGWQNHTIDELKTHLKTLRSKLGCSGSVKLDKETQQINFMLFGDQRIVMRTYLMDQMGFSADQITIHGAE